MNRLTNQAIIKLCHDVQIGTGGMDYADALNRIAQELTIRGEQETPQEAWDRGKWHGYYCKSPDVFKPYVAPPYQEEKETGR